MSEFGGIYDHDIANSMERIADNIHKIVDCLTQPKLSDNYISIEASKGHVVSALLGNTRGFLGLLTDALETESIFRRAEKLRSLQVTCSEMIQGFQKHLDEMEKRDGSPKQVQETVSKDSEKR